MQSCVASELVSYDGELLECGDGETYHLGAWLGGGAAASVHEATRGSDGEVRVGSGSGGRVMQRLRVSCGSATKGYLTSDQFARSKCAGLCS